jgi:hypothetical protein
MHLEAGLGQGHGHRIPQDGFREAVAKLAEHTEEAGKNALRHMRMREVCMGSLDSMLTGEQRSCQPLTS